MSSKVAILIAIVIGVIAAVFIHSYLNQQKLDEAGRYVIVMKVVRTIPAGGKLSDNSVEEVRIPSYAYSSNMQVTPGIYKLYRGQPVKNQCDAGKYLSMADLTAGPESGKAATSEEGFVHLNLNLPPGQLSGLDVGSTVMLVIQEPIRYTSGINRADQDAYRHTLITNLTVLGFDARSTGTGSGASAGFSFVRLKVPTRQAIAIGNTLKQNRNILIFRYNPEDETIGTDGVMVTFTTKTNSPKEILEKLNEALKSSRSEE